MIEKARFQFPQMEAFLGHVKDEALGKFYDKHSQEDGITTEDLEAALAEIDKELRMLPPTAQVAAQQGKYLAKLLSGVPYEHLGRKADLDLPFEYSHAGSMAYVGGDRAVIESPLLGVSTGLVTMMLWRGAYWSKSVSLRCKVLIAFDWLKAYFLGRDSSRL